MRSLLHIVFVTLICSLAPVGCAHDEAPAELRAREVFAKAKRALLRGDHRESKRLLSEAVLLYGHLNDEPRLAETCLLLGETYSAAAEFDSAFILLTQSRKLYQRVSDKAGIRATVLALAATHRIRGEDQHAFAILMEELRLEEALGDVYGVRRLTWELIPVCRALGDGESEYRMLKQLLSEHTAEQDNAMLARVHGEFGQSSLRRSNYSDAAKSFLDALPFATRAKDTVLAIQTYLWLAVAYDRLGRQTEAFQMFTEGIRRADQTRGAESLREEMLLRIGNIYLRGRQYDQAHKFLNTALRLAIKTQDKLVEAYALVQLGNCLNETGSGETENNYNAAANLLSHISLPWANAYIQTCLGIFAQKSGRLNAALEHFRVAAACFDSSLVRRDDDMFTDCANTFYQSQQASPYDALIELLFQLGKTDKAFLCAAKKNRNAQFRLFSTMDMKTRSIQLNEALQAYANVKGSYIGAEQRLAEAFSVRAESRTLAADVQRSLVRAGRRMHELGDSIAMSNKQFSAAVSRRATLLFEIQRRVPEGTALVVYIPTKRSLYTFVVTKTSTSVEVSAVDKQTLRLLMAAYVEALRQANTETELKARQKALQRVRELSSRLYGFLLRPVDLSARNVSQLFVVLPTDLPIIPLHALQQEGRSGVFAIQRYAFRYLPDVEALTLQGARINSYPVVVGFGNQGRTTVDVEYEVRDAKAFYKDAKLYFNHDATLERLQSESGDVLHAAFEIQYRAEQPNNSFFVLGDGTGYASAHYYRFGELFSVAPFSAVLVSNLSNAPLTPIVPRIFLMNGTADVVVNSYVPLRKAKKFFNDIFYTNLLTGTPTEIAYRNALLEMIKNGEYSQPNMWAGFSLW